ncbi:O-antigen polymerase [Flectobacillus longus]|uniref:O-antigen polymerase n=1 Tax=Flectobacillus longus TaxID=2984207 RepID=UPI0024B7CCE8|nr:O-antigen polymerase [Flectobacillus longus]MDI9880434.1 O-antigen polymerase [Flectobacillus longus]
MTLALLLILLIGNSLLYRSLLNPIVIQTGLWLMYYFIFWYNQAYFSVNLDEISPFIGLSCLGFSLGGLICWGLYQKVIPEITIAEPLDDDTLFVKNLSLFYPIVLLSLVLTLPMVVKEVGQFSWGDIQELRNTLVENDGKRFGLYGLIQTLSSVYLVLLLTHTSFSWRNGILVVVFLVYTYLLGSRGQLIFFVVPLAYDLLWKNKISAGQAILGSLMLISLIVLITIGRTSDFSGESIIPMLLTYAVASLPALSLVSIDPVPYFGYNTFRVVWLWIGRLGFNIPVAPVISEWISTPLPTNTYSYLKPYYLDFGMIGVFVIPLLLGFGYNLLYFRAKRFHITSCYLLGFLIYALLMQPIEEQYFRWLTNWFYIVLVMFFLKKVEIKWFDTK